LERVPVVNKFEDVFPEDLPGLPPDSAIEIVNELVSGTALFCRCHTFGSSRNERVSNSIIGIVR
jgi:hypothetical protein